jgi:phage virion morphogenesis protein
MAGAAIRVRAEEAAARLRGVESRGENLTPVLRAFGQYMLGSVERNFAAGGRPTAWEPLKFMTKVYWHTRRKSFWGKTRMTSRGRAAWDRRKPLTDMGRLRRSIQVAEVTPRSVAIGTSVIYAAIHQFGGMAGRGRKVFIPARPYLVFQDEDIQRADEMIAAYIMGRP